jgi:hypothetical protein
VRYRGAQLDNDIRCVPTCQQLLHTSLRLKQGLVMISADGAVAIAVACPIWADRQQHWLSSSCCCHVARHMPKVTQMNTEEQGQNDLQHLCTAA